MPVDKFENLVCWQKGQELSVLIYKSFLNCKDYSFRDQIQRAGISVSNNIAEGFERKSNKEFVHFLYISKGSCGEVRSMLYLALQLGYINQEKFNIINNLSTEISKIIAGLIKSL